MMKNILASLFVIALIIPTMAGRCTAKEHGVRCSWWAEEGTPYCRRHERYYRMLNKHDEPARARVLVGDGDVHGIRAFQPDGKSARELSPASSNLALPQFGRRKDCDGIVTPGSSYPRSVAERLKDYFHPCLKREPINEVDEAALAFWRKKNIRSTSLEEFASGRAGPYLRKFRVLIEQLVAVSAECFRYGLPQKAKAPCEIVNTYYGDMHYWRKVATGSPMGIREMNADFAKIEEHLHNRLDELDKIHAGEFLAWTRENKQEFEKLSAQITAMVENAKRKRTMEKMKGEVIAAKASAEKSRQEAEEAKREKEEAETAAAAAKERARMAEEAAKCAADEARRQRDETERYQHELNKRGIVAP